MRTPERFSCTRLLNVAEHGLDLLEAVVNPLPKKITAMLTSGAGSSGEQGQRQSTREHDGDGQDEGQAGFEPVHDARAQHHADGVEVVGGARHDVAGAVRA